MAKSNVTAILGGSFNPVHCGHMMLAQYVREWGYADQVWLMLSPLNPLKVGADMMPDLKRLAMLHKSTRDIPGIETCDLELSMPRPSYTINTLDVLKHRYPTKQFKLLIGSDNWAVFEKWKDWQRILDEFGVLVYPRRGYPMPQGHVDGMEPVDAPIIDLSSTFIRKAISQGRDISLFLPPGVYKYIRDNHLYEPKRTNE